MGASKRLSELCMQGIYNNKDSKNNCSNFSIVRFGNVLESSGSVIPKFKKQIESGGPVTVTHPDVTRYFMTISEASQLVIQSAAMSTGGEVYILEMGKPMKIIELAKRMVELSGNTIIDEENPNGEIELEIIGLRPGEKLNEELLIDGEKSSTSHPQIFKSKEKYLELGVLRPKLDKLRELISNNDLENSRRIICELVPEYTPDKRLADWTHIKSH